MNTLTKILTLFTALLCLTLTSEAQQRSMEDVISIIENSAPQLLGNSQNAFKSKSFGQKQNLVVASSQTKALKSLYADGQSEAFYIYNAQGGGFMLISADERMHPILGYADSGTFDTDSLPPNLKAWLQGYVAEANAPVTATTATATSSARSKNFGAKNTKVEPLITAEWGQTYPYNELCPTLSSGSHAVTGCGATAMAQIMYKYKSPTTGTGSKSYTTATNKFDLSFDFAATTFDWANMKDTYTSSETDETVKAIATLMFACGVASNMDYNTSSASTIAAEISGYLNHFGYDKDMAIVIKDYMQLDDWHTLLLKQLDDGCPLPTSGFTTDYAGHAYIIDGYNFENATDYPYYHINWGWDGYGNGYFLMTDMKCGGYSFTEDIMVITNVKPDDGTETQPTFMQIASLTPSSQSVDLTKNQKLSLDVTTLTNGSCQTFNGSVVFCLKDADGNTTDVYSMTEKDMQPSNYYPSTTVNCNIPNTIASGDYTIAAYSIPTGSTTRYPITMGNDPGTISITSDPSIFYPSVVTNKVEASVTKPKDVSLTASYIVNAGSTQFNGSLQMAVADYASNFITTFGDTKSITNLNPTYQYSYSYSFTGTLPTEITDGAYKLYLGACQTGYNNWAYVQTYNTTYTAYIDAPINFWVNNNEVTLTAPYAIGDVNHDGYINIADLTKLIDLKAASYATKDLTFWTADLNEDGVINDDDITALKAKVLSNTEFSASASTDKPLTAQIIEHNNNPYLIIYLNNASTQFNALQFDLALPSGLEKSTAETTTFSSRATNFTALFSDNNRLAAYSDKDECFTGTEGAIAYIPLNVTSTSATGSITLSNIVLSTNNCSAVSLGNVTIELPESLPTLAGAIANAEAHPRGTKLGQYTASEAFETNYQNAKALTSDASIFDVAEAITALSSEKFVFNTPAEGQLIHIKDANDKYMTCRNTTDGSSIEFSATKDEATIFCYYGGNRLVAYKTGCYVYNKDGKPCNSTTTSADETSLNFSILPSNKTTCKYLVTFSSGSYMKANGEAEAFSSASAITSTDFDFTLEEAEGVKVTISSQGMSTFYSPVALEIPAGVKAYTGEYDSSNNTIKLTALHDIIPANTGVLLEGTANEEVTFATASAADETTTSCLLGNVPTAATATNTNVYTLQVVDGALGFYRYTGTSLNGFKAYFATNSSSPGFTIIRDSDEAEGIHAASTATDGTSTIYDLSGNAVTTPLKGQIYIINGKKVKK